MVQSIEASIIEEVLSGEKEAYAKLVDRYKAPLYNLAYRMTSNAETARDLAQESFVRAYVNLHRYRSEKSFFTWIYTICLNLTRNHLEKKREVLTDGADARMRQNSGRTSHNPSPEELLIEQQNVKILENALHALPVDLKEAVVLRYMQELSFDQVAQILGVSLSAAKMRVYRGLERLRSFMTQQDGKNGS